MRKSTVTPLWPLLAWLLPLSPVKADLPQPLFDSDEPLVVRIEAPIGALLRQRGDDVQPEELEGARLTLLGEPGGDQTFDIKIMARGNFRRRPHNCDFPPFWINFKKSQVKGTLFENQNRLKVVSHCVDRKSFYGRYLVREYLCYKTWNLLTEASFRVRLLRIEYVSTDSRYKNRVRPGFFIEHPSNLGKRIGGKRLREKIVLPELFDPVALNRAEFFEMLIGNTDFSFVVGDDECCHNARVYIMDGGDRGFVPVPYDFDLAGVVDMPYAKPNPALKTSSVRDRRYRGIQTSQEVFDDTIRFYREHRDDVLALWENTPLLKGRDKRRAVDYLKEFFDMLDDPEAITENIIRYVRTQQQLRRTLEHKYPDAFSRWSSASPGAEPR